MGRRVSTGEFDDYGNGTYREETEYDREQDRRTRERELRELDDRLERDRDMTYDEVRSSARQGSSLYRNWYRR